MYGIPRTDKQKLISSNFWRANNPMFNKEVVEKIKKSKLGTINCFDIESRKFVRISADLYHSNKDRYKNNNSKEAKKFKGENHGTSNSF